jgi:putative acetyltransferase
LASTHYAAALIAAWSANKEPSRYQRALAEGEIMFVAVKADGSLVGFSAGQWDEVRAVYVDPGHARRGIGSQLLAAIERDALARDETLLRLDASLNAVAFYAAHGYEARGNATHPLRSGDPLECVVMTKVLSSRP